MRCGCIGLALLLLVTATPDATAQRKGFIIGFGLGPGLVVGDIGRPMTSAETPYETWTNAVGRAADFKIGAMISQSVALYVNTKMTFHGSNVDDESQGTGLTGLGVTYHLPSGFQASGVIGVSHWIGFGIESGYDHNGFGLGAGIGYEFAKHFVIALDGSWGQPTENATIFNVTLTLNVLSH